MSFDRVQWVLKQDIIPGTTKYVLVLIAWHSSPFYYQSIAALAAESGLNRKTVERALKQLQADQWIEQTGRLKGKSNQVIEYQFIHRLSTDHPQNRGTSQETEAEIEPNHPQKRTTTTPKNGVRIVIDNKYILTRAHVDPPSPVDNPGTPIPGLRKVLQ